MPNRRQAIFLTNADSDNWGTGGEELIGILTCSVYLPIYVSNSPVKSEQGIVSHKSDFEKKYHGIHLGLCIFNYIPLLCVTCDHTFSMRKEKICSGMLYGEIRQKHTYSSIIEARTINDSSVKKW